MLLRPQRRRRGAEELRRLLQGALIASVARVPRAMARFAKALNEQIGYEFAASQQYVAIAVYYDALTLPQLAAHFYRQAVEERNHAMIMVQYLLDADLDVVVPGVDAPHTEFADVVVPVQLALDQEKRVTAQISELVKIAREEGDLVGEQFLHWFLQEQREEVSSMSALLNVTERSRDNVMLIEEYLARESGGANPLEAGAPPAAGGAL
jgi:bacterioferritin B